MCVYVYACMCEEMGKKYLKKFQKKGFFEIVIISNEYIVQVYFKYFRVREREREGRNLTNKQW